MPILSNAKHECFAQAIAAGKTATEAMKAAGYSDPRNSTRLTKNDEIAARVAEIQGRAATRTEITIETLTAMYLKDRELAYSVGQPAAARSAADSIARLHGLWVDKVDLKADVRVSHEEMLKLLA